MLWRPAARIVTGPFAFFVAGLIDILAYALGALRRRLGPRLRESSELSPPS
ncbi:MAG: hypothetical protein JO153_06385 [Solirubrobacterales bacterium]|nr:hypothetical protein [Solirubrobacterales bacterium]MBV9916117.1 hypothetical protein [Solirubrobacterales bacterium]